ncbi:MAG: hypothetical protein ACO1OF_01850 [Adhaeribacter sp.]
MKILFSKWTQIAAILLIAGALAWAMKLGVIISTNGRIINTGAAAFFMRAGLLLLAIGSTGIGYRLSYKSPLLLRILAILLSPVVVFGSIMLLGMLTNPLFKDTGVWYAQEEGPIGVAVVVYLIIGYVLYRSYKPLTAQ